VLVSDLDKLITVDRVFSSSINKHLLIELQEEINCNQLVGWLIEQESIYLLSSNSAQAIKLQELPIAVAIIAWQEKWLDDNQLNKVLISNNHLLKPGDQGVINDNDGHYSTFCWCGWKSAKLYLSNEDADLNLLKHINNH
jgi:hypothetical protein